MRPLALLPALCGCLLLATGASAQGPEPLGPPVRPAAPAYSVTIPEDGTNLLADPGFETADTWNGFGAGGYTLEPRAGRNGTAAARAERATADAPPAGAGQSVVLNQTRATPLVVRGWSRAEDVSGVAGSDYSLYCDLVLADGTPLWGEIATFAVGTHDWQQVRVVIEPRQPVRSIVVYGLFRNHTGTVWFDDFSLSEVETPETLMRLDGNLVQAAPLGGPPPGELVTTTADDYLGRAVTAGWRGNQLVSYQIAGQELLGPSTGGWLLRDAAAEGDFLKVYPGTQTDLRLAVEGTPEMRAGEIRFRGTVTNLDPQADRAVTLLYALPLGPGWEWATMSGSQPTDEAYEFGDWVQIGSGSNGRLSRWPLGTVTNGAHSLTLALLPETAAQYRIGFSARAGLLYIAYDFGLLAAGESGPAQFGFALLPSAGAWGLRNGLDAWFHAFPEQYEVRVPDQGNWMAFAKISEVEGWEDFGFRIKEGDNETAWDNANDILTYRYSEMGTYWMSMPPETPRTYEAALAQLQAEAADEANQHRYRYANAVLQSGSHDAAGRFQLRFLDTPWADGAVWSLNPSPYLTGDHVQAQIAWGPAQQAAYEPDAAPQLTGEYLDSLEGYVTADFNYRRDHLAAARFPLTFIDGQPVLHKMLSIAEFSQRISHDLHARGHTLMANSIPYRFGFMAPWFDILGTETDWGRAGEYTPDTDDTMIYRRALTGGKPYCLLLNTRFEPFGPYMERYFQRALAFGMFPSMFSHNAAEEHYFQNPAWYNRDRALFQRYMPLVKQVAEAGWQPVTGARARDGRVHLERFGPARTDGATYLTLHNNSAEAVDDLITFDGRPEAVGRPIHLEPWETVVWTWEPEWDAPQLLAQADRRQ